MYDLAIAPASDLETPSTLFVPDVPPNKRKQSRRRNLIVALSVILVVGGVIGGIIAYNASSTHAVTHEISVGKAGEISVCYDSYNSWENGNMEAHFRRIKERFSGVRTYQTKGTRNHIEVAAQVGLHIHAGVWIKDEDWLNDMKAVVDGAKRFPGSVKAILVGNEELIEPHKYDQYFVIGKVKLMKEMLEKAGIHNIPVGSVQTDGNWLNNGRELAEVCDVIGVNIHPFFGSSDNSKWNPIQDLDERWKQMVQRYGKKVLLTETGWPTGGSTFNGHVPNFETTRKFANDVMGWIKNGGGGEAPSYFLFHDPTYKHEDYERSFGLAWENGQWKFDFAGAEPPKEEFKGITFVNSENDMVLAAVDTRQVEFHKRWGWDWALDQSSQWTVRESTGHIASWDANAQIDLCLDAYEPWNGGHVHTYPCIETEVNQKWQYDHSTKQIRHLSHEGFCLDMKYPEGGTPHLYTCLDVPLQKFEWWSQ